MNNIIKVSVVVTLALVIALFAGCGKKKPEKENESSVLMNGDITEIFGENSEETSDIGKVELVPGKDEDTVDAGVLDQLEGSGSSSSEGSSSEDSSSKNNSSKNQSSSSKNESSSKNQSSSSKNESSSKNQSSSSKNESSSKNQSSSSKNESSSKNQSSSSKDSSSSKTSSTMGGMDKDNDSKVYTPGWI